MVQENREWLESARIPTNLSPRNKEIAEQVLEMLKNGMSADELNAYLALEYEKDDVNEKHHVEEEEKK
ncbi:hypothetical protein HYS50_03345 [Candidatus Woesearchaeota archaeon]|nr:hypothetical protein [Candidatus Woesearchaeota archaeon]